MNEGLEMFIKMLGNDNMFLEVSFGMKDTFNSIYLDICFFLFFYLLILKDKDLGVANKICHAKYDFRSHLRQLGKDLGSDL